MDGETETMSFNHTHGKEHRKPYRWKKGTKTNMILDFCIGILLIVLIFGLCVFSVGFLIDVIKGKI